MPPEQQERQRKLISGVQKKLAAFEEQYNKIRPQTGLNSKFHMNLGEAGIKELLVALIMAGELGKITRYQRV